MEAVARLGEFATRVDYEALPEQVRERARLVLLDLLGVAVAGARTPELRALLASWNPADGPARLLGTGRGAAPDAAAWLNGTAACALELDEGNKHAQGHPAAHVVFAALAELASAPRRVSGRELLSAVVAGYEVAARFGRATERRAELHTHGHWGATGAGAAAARVRGLPPTKVGAAIDAAAGMVYVTPWSVVLAGSFVRNLWAAGSNVSGLLGARLAAAGVAEIDGTAGRVLGGVVGTLRTDRLTENLGMRWDIAGGYFKRHSCCAYTHPAVDAVLALRQRHGIGGDDVARVTVATHRLTLPLARLATGTRLAAMFSLPYVVAVAARYGRVTPELFSAEFRADRAILNLADRVEVRHDPDLDARLPAERPAVVTMELTDGRWLTAEQPNPIGDADHHPFDRLQVLAKLTGLIGSDDAARFAAAVEALPGADDAAAVLGVLP